MLFALLWSALCVFATLLPTPGFANNHVANATAANATRMAATTTPTTIPAKSSEKKDFWDKLDAASGIIAGLAVAGIGFYATNIYNKRQKKAEDQRKDKELLVNQVQTVASFIPHLSGTNEEAKRAALVLISKLGNAEVAVELSKVFSSPGAIRALTDIASETGARGAEIASQTLLEILAPLQSRVAGLTVNGSRRAAAFVVSENRLATTAHAVSDSQSAALEVFFGDIKLAARLVLKDDERDLALLAVDEPLDLQPIEIAGGLPQPADAVTAFQIGINGERLLAFGRVTAVNVSPGDTSRHMIATNLPGFPGVSGSPVVNNEGKLLGVMHSRDQQGRQYLLPATDLFNLKNEVENIARPLATNTP